MESETIRHNIGTMAKAKMVNFKKEVVYDKWIDLIKSELSKNEK